MGDLRQANDGHWYERRRSYGGGYYTVQRDPEAEEWQFSQGCGCLFAFLLLIVVAVGGAYTADQNQQRTNTRETELQRTQRLNRKLCSRLRSKGDSARLKAICAPIGL